MNKLKTGVLAFLGGLSIVFGIVLANNINHIYLSPLMFSLGIVFTIILRLELITRAVPAGEKWKKCCLIGLLNFIGAFIAGGLLHWTGNFPHDIPVNLVGAIGTGIIIGLVSVANREKGAYTVPVTFMLMFAFVYLKLPHCVVSAFYLSRAFLYGDAITSLMGFFSVVGGNIVGGSIIRYCYKWVNKLKE